MTLVHSGNPKNISGGELEERSGHAQQALRGVAHVHYNNRQNWFEYSFQYVHVETKAYRKISILFIDIQKVNCRS